MSFSGFKHGNYKCDVPYLEIRESSNAPGLQNSIIKQPYLGKLNLVISRMQQTVFVRIREAELPAQILERVYVKVKLFGRDCKSKVMRTDESITARWDDEWTWKLKERHGYKSVQVSIWRMPRKKEKSAFLIGCMCFSVGKSKEMNPQLRPGSEDTEDNQLDLLCSSLPSPRGVIADGWFFLLHRSLGRTKHLQVDDKRQTFADQDRLLSSSSTTSTTRRALFSVHGEVSLLMSSSHGTYGMKLDDHAPVRIVRVVSNSPAWQAGLQVDDCVTCVNGIDVSDADAVTVATMIKHAKQPMHLTYSRHPLLPIVTLEQSPPKLKCPCEASPISEPTTQPRKLAHKNSLTPIMESPSRIDTSALRSDFRCLNSQRQFRGTYTRMPLLSVDTMCVPPYRFQHDVNSHVFNKTYILHHSEQDLSDFLPSTRSDD